jgi:hypothetical protein
MNGTEGYALNAGCPGLEEVVDYFRMRLLEARMIAMEAHFASCAGCADESRAIFETLVELDAWTPESMGEAVRREALVIGLAQAEEDEPEGSEWGRRIGRWRQGIAETADGGLELIVEASGVRIVTQTLREFVARNGLQFEPVVADRGPASRGGSGAPGKLAAGRTAAVLSVEKPDVRVSVGEDNKVEVTLQSWPEGRLPPGILVIDRAGKQRPLRLELKREESGQYKAEFSRETGAFMILFAPLESRGGR